jgi:uncharacterized protein YycO
MEIYIYIYIFMRLSQKISNFFISDQFMETLGKFPFLDQNIYRRSNIYIYIYTHTHIHIYTHTHMMVDGLRELIFIINQLSP